MDEKNQVTSSLRHEQSINNMRALCVSITETAHLSKLLTHPLQLPPSCRVLLGSLSGDHQLF